MPVEADEAPKAAEKSLEVMRSNKPDDYPSLFAMSPGTPLSLVGARATESSKVHRIVRNRSTAKPGFGRPGDRFCETEYQWASRAGRKRKAGRFNPELLRKTEVELKKQGKLWQEFVDYAMAVWLEAGSPNLVDRAPACSCSGSCCVLHKDQNKTTTTTTAVARNLPGFPSELLEIPHKTLHPLQTLWDYAMSSYRQEFDGYEGVAKPHFWIREAWKTGKYDSIVSSWMETKQRHEQRLQKADEKRQKEIEQMRRVEPKES